MKIKVIFKDGTTQDYVFPAEATTGEILKSINEQSGGKEVKSIE